MKARSPANSSSVTTFVVANLSSLVRHRFCSAGLTFALRPEDHSSASALLRKDFITHYVSYLLTPCQQRAYRVKLAYSAALTYSLIGGQEQTRLRSPATLSMRETGGQYFAAFASPAG